MITPVTGALLDEWCAVLAAAMAAESGSGPDAVVLAARIRAERPGTGVRRWAAVEDARVAGVAQSTPDGDAAFVRVYVPEPHRRRGIGSALFDATGDGRPRKAIAVRGSAGERFAMRRGADVLMRLVVLEHRIAGAAAAGDDVVCWVDGAPDDLLDSYAAAYDSLADAPDSHHQSVGAGWDAGRIRAWERSVRTGGRQLWVAAIVRDGVVVAFTEIETGPEPTAGQHATVVLPAHRRQGLGVAVKRALAARLHAERPDITAVTTTVNAANTAMLALNERVGYRPVRTRLLLRLPG